MASPAILDSQTEAAHIRRYLQLILFVWAAVYVTSLFRPALLDDADTVHAEAAREMLTRHDWVTLHADGVRYLEKAPLQYWMVALSYKFFGVSEWTARLPLTLAALALAVLLFKLGSHYYSVESGFFAALVTLTSFGPYIFTRFFIPDLIVGLWLTIGFAFFLHGLQEPVPSRLACWGLAVSAALNVLTKGLIGLVFPAAIIFLYLLFTKNLRHLLRMRLLSSFAVFFVIAAPWHILAALRNPAAGQAKGFLWFYFVNEHFKRYLGTRYPKDYDTVPFFLFWGLMLLWLLPWSAFLPQALAQVQLHLRRGAQAFDFLARPTLLFGLWAAVILVFFSFSTRQEYYVVPSLPALAMLLGTWLGRESSAPEHDRIRRSGRISAAVLLGIGVIAFGAAIFLASQSKTPAPGTDIADLLKQNPQDYALSMGHVFDLTPQALGAFRAPLLGTGIAFLIGTFLSWHWRRRNHVLPANLALAGMMVVILYCAHWGFIIFEPVMSSKTLAQAIDRQYKPSDVIVINAEYEQGSSINFYTQKPVHILNHVTANLWYGSLFPDVPPVFEDNDSFRKLWNSPTRVFLWTEGNNIPTSLLTNPMYSVAHSGGKLILSNQPNQ